LFNDVFYLCFVIFEQRKYINQLLFTLMIENTEKLIIITVATGNNYFEESSFEEKSYSVKDVTSI